MDEQSEFVEQLMINEGMAVWEVALAVASVLLVLAELLHWFHCDAVAQCETRC